MSKELVQVELGGGQKSAPQVLDKTIVRISSRYYKKDSDLVVLVRTSNRRRKYFRKVSPLITKIGGEYYTKKSIKDFNGVKASIYSPDVVMCEDGEYRLKVEAVESDGRFYPPSYKEVVSCCMTGNKIHISDAITILRPASDGWDKTYLTPDFKDDVVTFEGDNYLKRDCEFGYDYYKDKFDYIPYSKATTLPGSQIIFVTFNTLWSGDMSRVQLCHAYGGCSLEEFKERFTAVKTISAKHTQTSIKTSSWERDTIYVRGEEVELFKNSILYHMDSNNGKLSLESFKKYAEILGINDDFDAAKASTAFRNYGASDVMTNHRSKDLGDKPDPQFCELPYSVGIEIESSGGALEDKVCRDIGLGKVGDRSVGACEYITPALSNQRVGEYIDDLESKMQGVLMLDKRCATHIHIGALRLPKLTNIMRSTRFARLALRLGAKLEDEWFSMLPKYRSPDRYHCYSIAGYGDINEKTEDKYLGAYLYGGHEQNMTAYKRKNNYSYRKGGNAGRWGGGRYKWLNISNLLVNNGIRTIEFRLFPATYNANELKLYTLMSMLFVEFIIRFPDEIENSLYKVDWSYIITKMVKDPKLRMTTMSSIKQMRNLNNMK